MYVIPKRGLVLFSPSTKEWSFGEEPYFHVFVAEKSDVGLWLRQRPFKLCVTILRRHSKAKTYEGGGKSKKGPKVTKRPFLRISTRFQLIYHKMPWNVIVMCQCQMTKTCNYFAFRWESMFSTSKLQVAEFVLVCLFLFWAENQESRGSALLGLSGGNCGPSNVSRDHLRGSAITGYLLQSADPR